MKYGTYSKEMLRRLMQTNVIKNGNEDALNPGSFNLCLTGEMFRLNSFQHPMRGQSVWHMMKQVGYSMHHPAHPCDRGQHYLCRLQEGLYLPDNLYGMANPRSTTGRQFVHTRLLTDGNPGLDQTTNGYKGELWALIRCLAFPEIFEPGNQLTQLRIFNKDTRMSKTQLKREYEKTPMVFDDLGQPVPFDALKVDRDGSLYLTLNLSPKDSPMAYVAKQTRRAAYFSKPNPKDDFFEAINREDVRLPTEENHYYITTTAERLKLPNHITAEIAPIDERIIEARNNFAGFVDQGFDGEITCEIAVHEPIVLTHGQIIARLRFEYVIGVEHEDSYVGSYQGQLGPRLAKNFV